jgi:hypothetical protein
MMVFWAVRPCEIIDRYQLFGETYCPHFKGIGIFTALRTSDLIRSLARLVKLKKNVKL